MGSACFCRRCRPSSRRSPAEARLFAGSLSLSDPPRASQLRLLLWASRLAPNQRPTAGRAGGFRCYWRPERACFWKLGAPVLLTRAPERTGSSGGERAPRPRPQPHRLVGPGPGGGGRVPCRRVRSRPSKGDGARFCLIWSSRCQSCSFCSSARTQPASLPTSLFLDTIVLVNRYPLFLRRSFLEL